MRISTLLAATVISLAIYACSSSSGTSSDSDATNLDTTVTDLSFDVSLSDATADSTTDSTEPTPDVGLSDEESDDICEEFCENLASCEMGDAIGEDCEAECSARLESDSGFVANAACVNDRECDEERINACLGEIPEVEDCVVLCEGMHECGLLDDFEIPEDVSHCTAFCNGSMLGDPEFDGLECAIERTESCDAVGIMECFGEDDNRCEHVCRELQRCDSDDEVFSTFEDEEACFAHCEGLSGGQTTAFEMCMNAERCDSTGCDDLPDEPSEGCNNACDAAVDACGEERDQFANMQCPWLCEGLAQSGFVGNPAAAPACLSELDECPEFREDDREGDEGDDGHTPAYLPALVVCSVDMSANCREVCDYFLECEGPGFYAECGRGCGEADDELVAEVLGCIEEVPEDSRELCRQLGACLPDDDE